MTIPIVETELTRTETTVTLHAKCINEEQATGFEKCCKTFLMDLKKVDDRNERAKLARAGELVCPICREEDMNNVLNGVHTCLKCMHKTVPREDLKQYNRAYRRQWEKKRKH